MQASAESSSNRAPNSAPMQIGGVPITADHLRKLLSKRTSQTGISARDLALMKHSLQSHPHARSEIACFESGRAHNRVIT